MKLRYFQPKTYSAFMRFLSSVPSHMNNQHVLSFKRLFLPRTILPSTNETLFIRVNVIIVDMFDEFIL